MSDDLIKRLRHKHCCEYVCQCDEAADRIEELEAKLAKAVEALRDLRDKFGLEGGIYKVLAELEGMK